MSAEIVIERKYAPYTVHTDDASVTTHFDAIFDEEKRPLCTLMKDLHGVAVPGCEEAAAYTAWKVEVVPQDVYLPNGTRVAVSIKCTITTAMPSWDEINEADEEGRQEAYRFALRTAHHERGHGLACEHVAQSIHHFLQELPEKVAPADVDTYNTAVKNIISGFYVKMARKSDAAYDRITGHGLTQGAEAH